MAQVQRQKPLAVTDIPRNRTIERVSLELDLVEASTSNEVWDFAYQLGGTGREDLHDRGVPEVVGKNGVKLVLGDVDVR